MAKKNTRDLRSSLFQAVEKLSELEKEIDKDTDDAKAEAQSPEDSKSQERRHSLLSELKEKLRDL